MNDFEAICKDDLNIVKDYIENGGDVKKYIDEGTLIETAQTKNF